MSAAPVLTAQTKIRLQVVSGDGVGRELVFQQQRITIGRGTDNDLSFTNDVKMSRQHAELIFEDNRLRVMNTSKKNFILVDGKQVEEAWIEKEARIKLGEVEIVVNVDYPGIAKPVQTPTLVSVIDENATAVVEDQKNIVALKHVPKPPVQKLTPNKNFLSFPTAKNSANTPQAYAPPPPPPQYQQPKYASPAPSGGGDAGKSRFYIILAVVAVIGIGIFMSDSPALKKKPQLRRAEDVAKSIEESMTTVKEIETKVEKRGEQTYQYNVAQEHYIRGFRDYQKGQFARAMQSFQAARSLYPQHELAIKYEKLAKLKFDELVQFNMNQGKRYRQKNNYRLCKAAFAQVMIMLKDPSNVVYREGKQLYDECSLKMEARF